MNLTTTEADTLELTPEQQLEQDIALVMSSAIEHHHKQEYEDAKALYEAILSALPAHADANYNLAVLLVQIERPNDAIPYFETALGANPNNGNYWVSYINALARSGQSAAAWVAIEIAQKRGFRGPAFDGLIAQLATPDETVPTAANPTPYATPEQIEVTVESQDAPYTAQPQAARVSTRRAKPQEIQQHLTLQNRDRHQEALALARKLVARYPDDDRAWRALTASLHHCGQFAETLDAARKVLEYAPQELPTRSVLADTLRLFGRHAEAEVECRTMLASQPDYMEARRILALALQGQRRFTEALTESRRAVELAPKVSAPHSTLGYIHMEQGEVLEAEREFAAALELEPNDDVTHSNLLFCLAHNDNIGPVEFREAHREFGKRHEARARSIIKHHANHRDPHRKLQVGFVSGDLLNHAVSSYALPVIEQIANDPGIAMQFYYTHTVSDQTTEKMRRHAAQWHEVAGLDNDSLVEKIRRDRIDILIDLSGHTGRNRLVALTRKPAPVQASWIGYPATTGLEAMDYLISDRHLTPPGLLDEQFVEKLALLPAIAPFQPPHNCPPVNGLPALHNGHTTYGSFNRVNKLRPDVIALWARVLRADPTSRMVLGGMAPTRDQEILTAWFEAEGIDASRLTFRPRTSIAVYLQQHHQVDLCLDTFPYTGSTTTLNSLWMGVPTVTLPGKTMAGRGSVCWLQHVGLEEYIAHDADDFVERAIALAQDTKRLQQVRTDLRDRCKQSAAFQPAMVAAGLSVALRTMWQRWCAGDAPVSFHATLPEGWRAPAGADNAA
ncbi:tetratricopeptide repeat protein [Paraburkholderia sp. JHI869]|uniref:tetratricopeptide repeat protein n=1 Tax=Paraburkholderia sp. JHI869 TaxID=3112959 RepID=UPI0031737243